jgi:hypothetical protein
MVMKRIARNTSRWRYIDKAAVGYRLNTLRSHSFFQIIPPAVRTDHAPVAKLDKAPVYETGDYRFESCRVRHTFLTANP